MTDLSTTYLGLHLSNPLIPSASPLGASLDALRRMEDAGAAAVAFAKDAIAQAEYAVIYAMQCRDEADSLTATR
jgi:hypothetical protein